MKVAHYHIGGDFKALHVLQDNKDGTVNLGTNDGTLVVSNCPVVTEALEGHCTLVGASESTVKEPTVKELQDKAQALGIDTKDMKKADLVAAIEAKEKEAE